MFLRAILFSCLALGCLSACVTAQPTPQLGRETTLTDRQMASSFDPVVKEGEWVYKPVDYTCTLKSAEGHEQEVQIPIGGGGPGSRRQVVLPLIQEIGSEIVIDTLVYYSKEGQEVQEFSLRERKTGSTDPKQEKTFEGLQNVGCGFSFNSNFNSSYQVTCKPTHLIDRRLLWFCKNFQ